MPQHLKVEHHFYGISASSTDFECFHHLLLREPESVRYQRLDIDFSTPQEFDAQWPSIFVTEDADDIDLSVNKGTINSHRMEVQLIF